MENKVGFLHNLLIYTCLFIAISSFIISYCFSELGLMVISNLLILISNILYATKDYKKNICFLLFQITFFTLLLSSIFFNFFSGGGYGVVFQNEKTIIFILSILFISLFFIFLGYLLGKKKLFLSKNKRMLLSREQYYEKYRSMRKISRVLTYIFYGPALIILLERVLFIQNNDYLEYYLEYSSKLPYIIIKLGGFYTAAFFIFLATYPRKKEARLPMVLYIVYSIVSLFFGQRNIFVLNVCLIIIYIIMRELDEGKGKWFGKKEKIVLLSSVPFILIVMIMIVYMRTKQSVDINIFNLFELIQEFFTQQGGSVNIIGYTKIYENSFPQHKFYLFGPIYDLLSHTSFIQAIFNLPVYTQQTIETAVHGYSFGQTLTYLVNSQIYFNGGGLGSSYVAEAWKDFGVLGVIVINFIYGLILSKISSLFGKNILPTTIGLFFLRGILYAPRDAALNFIASTFRLDNVFIFFLIYFLSKIYLKKTNSLYLED